MTEPRPAWELVREDPELLTERLRLASGWLYRSSSPRGAVALAFVPDVDPPAAGARPTTDV